VLTKNVFSLIRHSACCSHDSTLDGLDILNGNKSGLNNDNFASNVNEYDVSASQPQKSIVSNIFEKWSSSGTQHESCTSSFHQQFE
jgi:hypothetical protein